MYGVIIIIIIIIIVSKMVPYYSSSIGIKILGRQGVTYVLTRLLLTVRESDYRKANGY